MRKHKRVLPLILAAILVFGLAAGCDDNTGVNPDQQTTTTQSSGTTTTQAPGTTTTEPDVTGDHPTLDQLMALYPDPTPYGTVTVGSTTQPNADYMWGFTNISPNASAKRMMFNNMALVVFNSAEEFQFNYAVIKEMTSEEQSNGDKTYNFEIYPGLLFNDGTEIKAKDYLFSTMLMSSPEFAAIDGNATYGLDFVGYEDFNAGTTKTFSGLRLLGDYEFSITISNEQLPYFYDISTFTSSFPTPMFHVAPGVEMTDSGNGATLSDAFNVDLLQKTILDPNTGYRFNPTVTPGAYQFVEFDDTQFTWILTINPNFKCMFDGAKPQIEKIIMKKTESATEMDELLTGQVDLIVGVTSGSNIDAGWDYVDENKIAAEYYPRNGYGKIAFHCDFGPTQFKAVRQAMTFMLDREDFGRQYSGGYAIVVDSRYSEAQWMYQERKDELDTKLTKYVLNIDKANELLDADGWVLNETGGAYVAGEGKIRHKDVDGELMPLVIEWCSSDNDVSKLLRIMLSPNAEKCGMKINETIFSSVLDFYYRRNLDGDPIYHMFNMGSGFGSPDTPWNSYEQDLRYWGATGNANYIMSDSLYNTTQAMKKTDPADREGFLDSWVEYIVAFNDELPDMPLYANLYHDFFQPRLKGYTPAPAWSIENSLPRAWIED